MKKKRNIAEPLVGLVILLLLVGGLTWFYHRPQEEIIQGEVEATQVDLAAKIAGRVSEVLVKEGESVEAGRRLLTFESPELKAKMDQAAAAKQAASAQRDKAYKGAREEEIEAAKNLWLQAKYAAELAETTFRRVERLHADGVVPAQRRDEAAAQWNTAREAAGAARARYDMALAGARVEDRAAASALVDQASGAVSEVQSYLAETTLTAPINGEVVHVLADPGELVSAGYPIITLVDLSDIWVTFNLREDRLAGFRMGDVFKARIPALGDREIDLKVSYISPMGDFATWRATGDSGGFDLKTFELRARPVEPVEGLRPGMSAVAPFHSPHDRS